MPSGGGTGDVSSIAVQVEPAVVDITSTFPEGVGMGTGMVITSSGEVLTNNHVVDGAQTISAQIDGAGPTYHVRVIGTDPADDVALVQLEGVSGLKTVSIGNSSAVSVGDTVVAIGNALGRGTPTATTGQVVALDRTITATDQSGANAETLTGLIQVNANIVPGDSGGPLVDSSGKVIGMDTAASGRHFRFRSGSTQGFAIPINTAMSIAGQLRSGNGSSSAPTAQRPLLGVQVEDGSAQGVAGALVVGVESGSPADAAGIAAGDVIVGLGGRSVDSASALSSAIRTHHPGDRVQVEWIDQSEQQRSATVQLAAA